LSWGFRSPVVVRNLRAVPADASLPFRGFRDPVVGRFLVMRFLVGMATQMQATAIGWQVYDMTGDPIALGLVGLAQFAPLIPLMPLSGQVADRVDRRRIIQVSGLVYLVCMLGLALLPERFGVWSIYGLLFVFGGARAFDHPAANAILPNLVRTEHIRAAVALNSSVGQAAFIAGPAFGGLLYAFGPDVVYGTAMAMIVGALIAVSGLPPAVPAPHPEGDAKPSLFGGIAFIWSNQPILGVMLLDLLVVMVASATPLLPIFAKDVLEIGPLGLGILRSTPAAGALLVGVLLAWRPIPGRAGLVFLWSLAGYGVATALFGISTSFALSAAALLLYGAADQLNVIVRMSLIQIGTPDHVRGRVSAVNAVAVNTANQLGGLEAGLLAAWLDAPTALVIGGALTLAVTSLGAAAFPKLRRVDRL
jgi:MFS family permease